MAGRISSGATQIASHQGVGAVSWITYADRLMEFPTALLGVALGVVLLPSLSGAQAGEDKARYSELLDWGLRLVLLLALPCAVALLVFPAPLVATYLFDRFHSSFAIALFAMATTLVSLATLPFLKASADGLDRE